MRVFPFLFSLKSFNDVSRKFKGCLKFERRFQERFKCASKKIKGHIKEFLKGVQKYLKEVKKVVSERFPCCFKEA